jgi:hypothetical protein
MARGDWIPTREQDLVDLAGKWATGAALPKTKFSRKTTLVIAHTEADKAQTAYYATCYENGKGEQGAR